MPGQSTHPSVVYPSEPGLRAGRVALSDIALTGLRERLRIASGTDACVLGPDPQLIWVPEPTPPGLRHASAALPTVCGLGPRRQSFYPLTSGGHLRPELQSCVVGRVGLEPTT